VAPPAPDESSTEPLVARSLLLLRECSFGTGSPVVIGRWEPPPWRHDASRPLRAPLPQSSSAALGRQDARADQSGPGPLGRRLTGGDRRADRRNAGIRH